MLTLEDIYAEHCGFVWRTVLRMGIPEHAVEDLMHEVFLVVQRRLDDYDGRVAMTTWLYHQTRGVVSNYRRRHRREQRRIALVDPKPQAPPDPEAQTERQRAAQFVREFLEQLDPDKREVFVLAEIEGIAMPEVARSLKIKLNTAYSRLRAARTHFNRAAERRRTGDASPRVRSRAG